MFDKEKFKKAVNLTMIEKGLSQAKLSKEIGVEGASLSLVVQGHKIFYVF
ncbi:MAG: hypothetical protein MJ197_08760 [Bacteroidales bacterium]|nr:hypothetical protein [Bacteroidales bacterium]